MKIATSIFIVTCAAVASVAVLPSPIGTKQYVVANADTLPTGSAAWWRAMDREGRGGNAAS